MCFGCSNEPSHRDGSFEYPQHMFWLRNEKTNFQLRTLTWVPEFRPTDKIAKVKMSLIISQPKHMLWVLKRQLFEHPKHMLKLLDKSKTTSLRSKVLHS